MNAHSIITPATAALDAAVAERSAALRPSSIDRVDGWALRHWIGGALITMGWYGSPRVAMQMAPEAGRWVEVGDRLWRSDDGRWLISR